MIVGRHYQNAYVTRDIAGAVARFKADADVRHESQIQVPIEITTPKGVKTMESKLAFLWVGDLQYEFIEPVAGHVDFYRAALPAGDALAFHHACMRVDDWDAFRARVAAQALPVAIEGAAGPLRFLYLDARAWLGHYLEYTNMPEEMWRAMGGR